MYCIYCKAEDAERVDGIALCASCAGRFTEGERQTARCDTCRFWSEMVAQAGGGRPLEALCLNQHGPHSSNYTTEKMKCDRWKHNAYGAVDCPPNYGEVSRAAYEDEEGPTAND